MEENFEELPTQKPRVVRKNCIMVRLSDDEYSTIKNNAELLQIAPAIYARNCVLGHKITAKKTKQIYGKYISQFAWIGNNLNQITKALNTIAQRCDDLQNIDKIEKLGIAEMNVRINLLQEELHILTSIVKQEIEQ